MSYFFDQLVNGVSLGCIYALIALGFSMVYGVLKLLNFAHSELFTGGAFVGNYLILKICERYGNDHVSVGCIILAIIGAGLFAGVMGVVLELIAYRPLRNEPKVYVLLSAIGMSKLIQDFGIKIFGAQSRPFLTNKLSVDPGVVSLIVLIISYLLLVYLVKKTKLGVLMRAVSEDAKIAELYGVRIGYIYSLTFFVGAFFAGVAGVVWGLQYNIINPQMGFLPGLKAFSISVIGSIGNLKGCIIIGILLGTIEVLLQAYMMGSISGFRDAFVFMVMLMVLILRPSGIMGEKEYLN